MDYVRYWKERTELPSKRLVGKYMEDCDQVRLHSAIGYIAPADKMAGRETETFAERDRKLEEARQSRKARRQVARGARTDGRTNFAASRSQVTITQVLDRLGHLDRLQVIGSERRGPCPIPSCDDGHNRSFSANIEKNVFRCFSPGCGAAGNVLDLWATVHKLPLRQAALDPIETFHLDVRATEKRQPVVPLPQSDRPVATNVVTCDNADRALRPKTTRPLPQRC